ncbi:hypothetical protein [Cytobacillus oceanisediminis]|uniref:Uncharacterized protein n=1 Tax=Cytobacillus oceanisediminis TaxID=665099 RepID=A0ABX3CJW3_9BACI|nr:hypothetical protein [Cytobacillus oceanisediminis]OHX41356.1 hypothetical protein BBV17_28580 [Cytobacillus oceanisediminis]
MEDALSQFINLEITPRKDIINERKYALDWPLPTGGQPAFIYERAEEIRTMYLMGMDVVLMKFIPVFIEDILKTLIVNFNADYNEQISMLYKDYEKRNKMYFWTYLEEIKKQDILQEEDFEYCQRYVNEKIRNNEIHNKEFTKYKGTENYLTNTETGETRKADEAFEKMMLQDPSWFRAINSNKTVEQIHQEVVGILNLIQRNSLLLNRSSYLATKDVYEGIGVTYTEFQLITHEIFVQDIDYALNQNPLIKTYSVQDENNQVIINLHYKKPVLSAEVFQTLSSLFRISSIENK